MISAKFIIMLFLVFSISGCDILPVKNEKAENQWSEKIQGAKELISRCFSTRKKIPIYVILKFRVFKNGVFSSYGILEGVRKNGIPFFQMIEPQGNKDEIICVRNVIKDIEFKLTDYRKSDQLIEVKASL